MSARAIEAILGAPRTQTYLVQSLVLGAAVLLAVGLWTPISGLIVVFVELWLALSRASGLAEAVLLASLGAALAAMGPGAHSVDATLYGRKRVDISEI